MKIIYRNANNSPVKFENGPMELIKTIQPGERYVIGHTGMVNHSDKRMFLCRESLSHDIVLDEDHAHLLPPEFACRRRALVGEALRFINDYSGAKEISLPTGEAALDFDCYWAIIHRADGMPKLRLKERQKEIEELHLHPDERESLEYGFSDIFDEKKICDEADKLYYLCEEP